MHGKNVSPAPKSDSTRRRHDGWRTVFILVVAGVRVQPPNPTPLGEAMTGGDGVHPCHRRPSPTAWAVDIVSGVGHLALFTLDAGFLLLPR
ncbi:hypothetical protein BRADI_3g06406v3 [Brachypodium distachyon]|uniref:Uncharacterized protein n=1 Tax=Brachypodium distachyon TaxID=15368 RepID=A0A2K2CVK4_BRADI|nr:hypothetical protein BRADI_3g06406v3 [Brachypodium distachyon]